MSENKQDKKVETYDLFDYDQCLSLLRNGVPPRLAAHASGIGYIALDQRLHDAEVLLEKGDSESWNKEQLESVKLLMAMSRALGAMHKKLAQSEDGVLNTYMKNADDQKLYKLSRPTVSDKQKIEKWSTT